MQVIDEHHNCYTIKYLRNKPVRELKGDEFLRLHLAEQDHLLEVKLAIDPEQSQEVRRSVVGNLCATLVFIFFLNAGLCLVSRVTLRRFVSCFIG